LLSIARHPPRDPDELRAAVAEIEEDALLTTGISAHAPYSVPEPHLRAAIALADELRRPWCAHWAETREEVAFLNGGRGVLPAPIEAMARHAGVNPNDDSALSLLERCGHGYRAGGLAHLNYLDESEMSSLAAARHVVMYCPRAHAFFGHDPHPVAKLRSAGVTVALATDSLASNDSLSIRDEMRFLSRTRTDLKAAGVLAMGTIDAAAALGLQAEIGSIEVGKLADLVAIGISGPPVGDPIEQVVSGAGGVVAVWVAGRRVI
jgi:cytosine/adenosine deaminase-related metal-dependent hydrolase